MQVLEQKNPEKVIDYTVVDNLEKIRRYIHNGLSRETKKGLITYDLLCGAMQDDKGNVIVIRKNLYLPSEDRDDWMVVTYRPGEPPVEEVVIATNTITSHEGDRITIEISPDVSYHGNYHIRFGVDAMYAPDGKPIIKSHLPYYGRGVGPESEMMVDTVYDSYVADTEQVIQQKSEKLAEAIRLDDYRPRDIGHTAIVG